MMQLNGEREWSPPPTDTRNPRTTKSVSAASWAEIGQLMEGKCGEGKGISHRNSRLLNEIKQRKLLHHPRYRELMATPTSLKKNSPSRRMPDRRSPVAAVDIKLRERRSSCYFRPADRHARD
ncbi:hypothetical protein EVAR_45879_1 [Eumeta japonica]|uniref:Uncharacterized protein n=1 Tax=Eumeta variegata TaxID=151549 RepID=A0A4C1XUS7_EUMVA|nr:hypothetical protein EVAR_45879_1 [Eumeta japonica]